MVQEKVDHARRAGRIRARLVFTLIGAAALVVGAFLDWTGSLAGNKLTLRSLVENDFHTRTSMLHTVGAVSVLIAAVAVLSLLDFTGWLTRLAGLAGIVVFAMFAIQVYRHEGQHFNAAYHALQAGAWCQLGGGVVLLIGGMVRYRRKRGRVAPAPAVATATDDTVVGARAADRSADLEKTAGASGSADSDRELVPDRTSVPETADTPETVPAAASRSREGETIEPDASNERVLTADEERERLEADTTVFRPPAPSEIGVGAVGDAHSSSRTS